MLIAIEDPVYLQKLIKIQKFLVFLVTVFSFLLLFFLRYRFKDSLLLSMITVSNRFLLILVWDFSVDRWQRFFDSQTLLRFYCAIRSNRSIWSEITQKSKHEKFLNKIRLYIFNLRRILFIVFNSYFFGTTFCLW